MERENSLRITKHFSENVTMKVSKSYLQLTLKWLWPQICGKITVVIKLIFNSVITINAIYRFTYRIYPIQQKYSREEMWEVFQMRQVWIEPWLVTFSVSSFCCWISVWLPPFPPLLYQELVRHPVRCGEKFWWKNMETLKARYCFIIFNMKGRSP